LFFINDKMFPRAGWNGSLGRIWPVGGSLETPTSEVDLQNLRTYTVRRGSCPVLERLIDVCCAADNENTRVPQRV